MKATNNNTFSLFYKLPIKNTFMQINIENDNLVSTNYLAKNLKNYSRQINSSKLAINIFKQLDLYFADAKHKINIDFVFNKIPSTDFQRKVWKTIQKIPVGKTITYGDIADKLKTSPRAVGNACAANHLPLLIPCHRVVGIRSLGGFNHQRDGLMLQLKSWLLDHEGVKIK